MTAAVIIHRFGPYHVARLRAAARHHGLVGVEVSSETREYAWVPVESDGFKRVTLCENDASLTPRELGDRLRRMLDEIQPDVVFVNGWSGTIPIAALQWCAKNRVRAVLMSESSFHDEPRSAFKEWVKRRIVAGVSAALVGGRSHAEYAARLGVPAGNIFLGYDAIDNDYFARGAAIARANRDAIRSRLNLPERFFLASNRFIPKKNLKLLVAAFAEYRKRSGSDAWDLVLLGDGPLRSELVRQIEDSKLSNAIHLPGFQQYDELPNYYGLASAFVHASTSEQWGLVVNEALAAGLPVAVSSACGCAPELVEDGVNGWRFDPHNPGEIAAALERLANLGPQAEAFGAAGRRIVDTFGPRRFSDGFCKAAEAAAPPRYSMFHRMLLRRLAYR